MRHYLQLPQQKSIPVGGEETHDHGEQDELFFVEVIALTCDLNNLNLSCIPLAS